MGKTQPVPGVVCKQKNMKELIACLAPNRRVEVEVKGESHQALSVPSDEKAPPRAGLFFGCDGVSARVARASRQRGMRGHRLSACRRYLDRCKPSTCASMPHGSSRRAGGCARRARADRRRRAHRRARARPRTPTRATRARDARRSAGARADARARQRAHARGDDAVARHRRRRAAQALARAAHLAARGALRRRRIRVRRHAARRRRDAARRHHLLQRHVLLSRTPPRAPASKPACARCSGCRCSTSRRRTPPMPTPTCSAGLAARDAFKHAPTLAFSLAPHAPYTVGDATWEKIVMYARQLDLPIQTHLAETRGRSRAERRAARRDAARAAASARRDRSRLHRDPRRAPRRRRTSTCSRRRAATSCTARSNMKLAQRHRAGRRAARARRQRRARHRRRRVEQPPRRLRRDAPRRLLAKVATGDPSVLPARDGAAHGHARRRARAGPRRARSARSCPASTPTSSPSTCRRRRDAALLRSACRTSSTSAGRECVTDVWVGGERIVADRALDDRRRSRDRGRAPASGRND